METETESLVSLSALEVKMGFRFRKSISIVPGVRLNIGKKGISSLSVGKRGASVNFGKNGTHANVGIPGSGLSYRTRLDGPNRPPQREASGFSFWPIFLLVLLVVLLMVMSS